MSGGRSRGLRGQSGRAGVKDALRIKVNLPRGGDGINPACLLARLVDIMVMGA